MRPVQPGDTIRVVREMVGFEPKGVDRGLLRAKATVVNQQGDFVLAFEKLTLYRQ